MKFLLFGAGEAASQLIEGVKGLSINIIGVLDNDKSKQGNEFYGQAILYPGQLFTLDYDYICILVKRFQDVYNQLVYGYHIDAAKVVDRYFLLKHIMMEKYQDDDDEDIQETISYWKNNKELTFLNQFGFAGAVYEEVFWDVESNMPYVIYKNRRMYYPRTYRDFIVRNGSMYAVTYREIEQHERSPHRYLTDQICIKENDIVVDAGAREGDFTLPYIDMIKKLYLFESDPDWVKALEMTYRNYKDKVVIIPKMLSDTVNEDSTTLSEVIREEQIDFIKMDIEGAEVKALSASQDLLKNNDIKFAVCCYHRKGDREKIEHILSANGYQCSVSNGCVVFIADPCILKDADFRKGVVYAIKGRDK